MHADMRPLSEVRKFLTQTEDQFVDYKEIIVVVFVKVIQNT